MFTSIKRAFYVLWDRLFPPLEEEAIDDDYDVIVQPVITDLLYARDDRPNSEPPVGV